MKNCLFILILSMFFVTHAMAKNSADKQITFVGTIESATGEQDVSSINTDDGNNYSFSTRDKVANQIYKVCEAGNKCKITAVVRNNDFIMSISKIEKVK